jgi:hypothetical protein
MTTSLIDATMNFNGDGTIQSSTGTVAIAATTVANISGNTEATVTAPGGTLNLGATNTTMVSSGNVNIIGTTGATMNGSAQAVVTAVGGSLFLNGTDSNLTSTGKVNIDSSGDGVFLNSTNNEKVVVNSASDPLDGNVASTGSLVSVGQAGRAALAVTNASGNGTRLCNMWSRFDTNSANFIEFYKGTTATSCGRIGAPSDVGNQSMTFECDDNLTIESATTTRNISPQHSIETNGSDTSLFINSQNTNVVSSSLVSLLTGSGTTPGLSVGGGSGNANLIQLDVNSSNQHYIKFFDNGGEAGFVRHDGSTGHIAIRGQNLRLDSTDETKIQSDDDVVLQCGNSGSGNRIYIGNTGGQSGHRIEVTPSIDNTRILATNGEVIAAFLGSPSNGGAGCRFRMQVLGAGTQIDVVTLSGSTPYEIGFPSSLSKFKNNQRDIDDLDDSFSSELIYKLQPRAYERIPNGDYPSVSEFGFIAEECEAVHPAFCDYYDENQDGKADNLLSVKYKFLCVPIIAEMKKLKKENEDLKAQMANVISRLEALESK